MWHHHFSINWAWRQVSLMAIHDKQCNTSSSSMQHGSNLELQHRAAFASATTQNLGDQFRTTSHIYPEGAICHVSTCIYYNGQLESCCKCRDLSQQGLFSRSSPSTLLGHDISPTWLSGVVFVGSFPQGFLWGPSTPKWRVQSICGFDPPLLMACKKTWSLRLKERGMKGNTMNTEKAFQKKGLCWMCWLKNYVYLCFPHDAWKLASYTIISTVLIFVNL